MTTYRGRFAPSPTGPLHLGSLLAALASFADARHHGGQWLLRIEDVDTARNIEGAELGIVECLNQCGMQSDEPALYQTQRNDHYAAALAQLETAGSIYPCGCSRSDIAQAGVAGAHGPVYPGTCRDGLADGRQARSIRLRVRHGKTTFDDRVFGTVSEDVEADVGDFILRRADGLYAYQLAVVVDDAAQGITDVVRGHDLLDSTARQIELQQQLGYATPNYLHVPILTHDDGSKLSKQTGAAGIRNDQLSAALLLSLHALGQPAATQLRDASASEIVQHAVTHWDASLIPKQPTQLLSELIQKTGITV